MTSRATGFWARKAWLAWALILLLLAIAGAPATAGRSKVAPATIHPLLTSLASSQPNLRVPILIQKLRPGTSSRSIAQAGGGEVDEDFPFINGFRMTVPARVVTALARNPNVRYISPDGEVTLSAVNTSALQTVYPGVSGAATLWNAGAGLTGKGVTVAVIDSGVSNHPDLSGRVALRWAAWSANNNDANGHGTHVAGTIAGRAADGRYIGVAPEARVVALKTTNDRYATSESGVVKALQWVYDNRATYGIRVVNMSISAATPNSYLLSPLAAAAEKVWQSGVVVVAAAGNRGPGPGVMWYPPGNDPFIITVGALDDNQTVSGTDDGLATFSSYGNTQNNFAKPDVVAPGRKVVAPLASPGAVLARNFPDRVTADRKYIRLSGTSMSTPVVSGLIVLMLERYPDLTPDQVKWALLQTRQVYTNQPAGSAGQVNIQGALDLIAQTQAVGQPLGQANQGQLWNPQVQFLAGNSSWEETDRSSAYWDSAYWDSAYWDSAYWDSAYWDSAYWDSAYWDSAYWDSAYWDSAYWDSYDDDSSFMDDTASAAWD